MASAAKKRKGDFSLPEWVANFLGCPVCMKVIKEPPIFQCENGHVFCHDCREQLKAYDHPCSECQGKLLDVRNSVLGNMLEQLPSSKIPDELPESPEEENPGADDGEEVPGQDEDENENQGAENTEAQNPEAENSGAENLLILHHHIDVMEEIKEGIGGIKGGMEGIKEGMEGIKKEIGGIKGGLEGIKKEIGEVKEDEGFHLKDEVVPEPNQA